MLQKDQSQLINGSLLNPRLTCFLFGKKKKNALWNIQGYALGKGIWRQGANVRQFWDEKKRGREYTSHVTNHCKKVPDHGQLKPKKSHLVTNKK